MLNSAQEPTHSPDWRQALREAIKSSAQLNAYLGLDDGFNDKRYPVLIPKNLAARIKSAQRGSPLWEQFVPNMEELNEASGLGLYDPIGDGIHSKGAGIIHRYKNRVLFAPTTVCPVNCRYCFRKNELAGQDEILKGAMGQLLTYLDANPQVEEVILTGGDPLMLSDRKLESIGTALEGKVKYLRLHTRTPIILPERVDGNLISLFERICQKFEVVSVAIHANHTQEFCEKVKSALRLLASSQVQLLSQSVLLKGVNDTVEDLKSLFQTFASLKIRPYYLHHPDKVKGAMRFYLPLYEGRKLYAQLREELPGWAIPHYVIDPENGQGKNLAYNPERLEFGGQLLDRFNKLHQLNA